MAATGAFGSGLDYNYLRSRVIMAPNAGPNPYAVTPPTTVNRLPVVAPYVPGPTTRMAPPTTIISDPIITTVTVPAGGGGAAPSSGSAPTGATTGAASGSTGTSDTSRLLDMIAGAFQPQAVSPSLAPTSVTSTSTGEPSSGGNPLVMLIVGAAVIGGIFWYVKRKKAA